MNLIPILLTSGNIHSKAYLCLVNENQFSSLVGIRHTLLHPQELDYYESVQSEKRKKEYLLGRYAAKEALKNFLNESQLSKINIYPGPLGEPVIHHETGFAMEVSISHSHEMIGGLVFPKGYSIGLDIEKIDPRRMDAIKSKSSEEEILQLENLKEDRNSLLTLLWTIKESFSKVLKRGLKADFKELAIVSITQENHFYKGSFLNHEPFQFVSWFEDGFALSISFPKKVSLTITR